LTSSLTTPTTHLWLTRLAPDPAHAAAWREFEDAAALHRRVMSLFPDSLGDTPRAAAGVLHRIEQDHAGTRLLIQSALPPSPDRLPPAYGRLSTTSLTPVIDRLRAAPRVRYRIVANATSKLGTHTTAGRPGQLVPLRGPDAHAWWTRHASQAGLRLDAAHATVLPPASIQRGSVRTPFDRTRFDGVATVTDADALTSALAAGIGRGKAYGCGLLTVLPLAAP
jgi:CRISPR system Cascade subunit CasE